MIRGMATTRIAHYHFPRIWADRHDDEVYVFANGHVCTPEQRRASLRQLIQMMRRERQA